jgi:uncharacterized repeat protein (TIGR02543 family)
VITASAGAGYQFSGWTGVDSSNGPIGYVTMTANRNVTAIFTQNPAQYQLTTNVSPSGSGTLTFSLPCCTYNAGTQVTITASAGSGYQFSAWGGVDSSNGMTGYVTMNGNRSIMAYFTAIVTQYQLTTAISPPGAGSVSPSCPSGCSVSSPITLTALPNAGYAFSSFSGSQSSSSNPASFAMTGAIAETANFTAQSPTIAYVSPIWGPANTPVTIAGAGWGATQGGSAVKFNGLTAAVTSWSATGIAALVPSGASSGPITVEVAGFTPAASPSSFTVSDSPPAGPTITSLSLTQGPPLVGFVIKGNGFPATPAVTLNGTPLTPMAPTDGCPSGTCITVQIPQNMVNNLPWPTPGTWPVVIAGAQTAGMTFQVVSPFGCAVGQ